MSDMSPVALVQNLADLSRSLDRALVDLRDADMVARKAKQAADLGYSKAFLSAEGAVEVRKNVALIANGDLRMVAEAADVAFQHYRNHLSALRTKIEVGRTLVSYIKDDRKAAGWAA
jgi:hypothetical protein